MQPPSFRAPTPIVEQRPWEENGCIWYPSRQGHEAVAPTSEQLAQIQQFMPDHGGYPSPPGVSASGPATLETLLQTGQLGPDCYLDPGPYGFGAYQNLEQQPRQSRRIELPKHFQNGRLEIDPACLGPQLPFSGCPSQLVRQQPETNIVGVDPCQQGLLGGPLPRTIEQQTHTGQLAIDPCLQSLQTPFQGLSSQIMGQPSQTRQLGFEPVQQWSRPPCLGLPEQTIGQQSQPEQFGIDPFQPGPMSAFPPQMIGQHPQTMQFGCHPYRQEPQGPQSPCMGLPPQMEHFSFDPFQQQPCKKIPPQAMRWQPQTEQLGFGSWQQVPISGFPPQIIRQSPTTFVSCEPEPLTGLSPHMDQPRPL